MARKKETAEQAERRRVRRRERYANDPEYRETMKANAKKRCPLQRKNHALRAKYGISLDEYNAMFEAQQGRCAICDRHDNEQIRSLAVDHCHTTGKIRALLCDCCNSGIGKFNEDVAVLQRAIAYVEKHHGNA